MFWFLSCPFDFSNDFLISKICPFDFSNDFLISQICPFDFCNDFLISKICPLICEMNFWFPKFVRLISKMIFWFPKFVRLISQMIFWFPKFVRFISQMGIGYFAMWPILQAVCGSSVHGDSTMAAASIQRTPENGTFSSSFDPFWSVFYYLAKDKVIVHLSIH